MRVDSWALTDVGRARKHNEDGWLIDDQLGLYAVADGMGGHAAGEVASAYGLRCVQEQLVKKKALLEDFSKNPTPEKRSQILREVELAINVASSAIYHMAQRDKKRHGMGTTLSMVLLVGNKAFMAHVGDSRIYLARAQQIHQLSEDHSYLWEQIKKGAITVEEAKRSPFSNVITRAVGITETVQVDTLVFDILPGDTYLACSDGLHGYIESEAELAQILSGDDGEEIPRRLIGLANARGSLVGYNSFLDGNLDGEGPEVDRELAVGELQLGLVAGHGPWTLAWILQARTSEFEGSDGGHRIGALVFGYSAQL